MVWITLGWLLCGVAAAIIVEVLVRSRYGGRDYSDAARLEQILDASVQRLGLTEVIHGGARGEDRLARGWAVRRGIRQTEFRADWCLFGRQAGAIRNAQMLSEGQPDLIIAFPGGPGTADMAVRGRTARLRVIEIDGDWSG